jgi:hypothetical protein
MPTSPFDFDAKVLIEQIDAMLVKLPSDSPLVDRVRGSVKTLISDISEVITYQDDSKERLQQIEQIVSLWESLASLDGKDLHPALQQIKHVLVRPIALESSSLPNVSSTDIANSSEENSVQLSSSEEQPPSQKEEVLPKVKKDRKKSSPPTQAKTENDYRHYCWELANLSGSLVERKIQREISGWDAKPYNSPRPGDIILHGTAFTPGEEFPPVWIGAIQEISLFAEVLKQLDYPNSEAQIWLSFADLSADSSYDIHLQKPQWCLDHEDSLPLWYRWHDLLWWAIMAPEADVFVNNKLEKLSEQREAICQTLLDHHKSFTAVLEKQDEYHISRTLHRVYSCFFQFLSPEDLDANEVPRHLFYRLRVRGAVGNNVDWWRKVLQIEERHAAGALTSVEYLGNVEKDTEKNTCLSTKHPFWKNRRVPEESEVLYWLRPRWKLKNTPQNLNAELLGSVLYCFG